MSKDLDITALIQRDIKVGQMLEQANGIAAELLAERKKQVKKGYTPDHDDEHGPRQLINAALSYALADISHKSSPPTLWPWEDEAWKPRDLRSNLIRATALLVAAIEAMDRVNADIAENADYLNDGA